MMDIVQKWNGLEQDDQSKSDKLAEAFLDDANKFENAWKSFDQS